MTNTPFKTFRDGSLKATIWQNQGKENNFFYSVDFIRSYKDSQDNWKETNSFSGVQLLKLAALSARSYEFILKQEEYDRLNSRLNELDEASEEAEHA